MLDQKTLKQRIIFRRIIQGLAILTIFLMALTRINHENDLFWQLKMGEQIWEAHSFPVADPYNFSNPGDVWTLEEWLPATSFYVIYKYFGSGGLIIYKAIIITTTFGLFMMLFNRLKVNLYLSLVVLFLAAMVNTRGIWGVFPSIFEYLFIVMTLFLLELYKKKKKFWIPVILIPFSLLWAQSHASFFLLTTIVAIYLVGDIISIWLKKKLSSFQPLGVAFDKTQQKSLLLIFLASLITPFISPNGYWLFIYPFRITFGKFTPYVNEYQKFWTIWRWDFSDFIHGFTLILIIILGIVFLSALKKLHPTDFLLGVLFTILALSAVRHVAVFALVALFLIARYLPVWFGEYRGFFKRSLVKDMLIIVLTIFFIFYYKTHLAPFGFDFSEDGYPKEAAELINQGRLSGNMFNHYNYGGYLIWKMPEYKVFIDGRLEMYQGKAGEDYTTILLAKEGYQNLLEKYQINFFISYLKDPIVEALVNDSKWAYVYHDANYVLFIKNDPRNQDFLAKYWSKEHETEFKESYKMLLVKSRAEDFHRRGLQAIEKRNYLEALNLFQQAVNTDHNFTIARLNLAQTYLLLGILEAAKGEYENVLQVESDNKAALAGLQKVEKAMINTQKGFK